MGALPPPTTRLGDGPIGDESSEEPFVCGEISVELAMPSSSYIDIGAVTAC